MQRFLDNSSVSSENERSHSVPHRQPTFNELLIHEVRAHPELYDQQHRVCTDNGERNFIWEVIAARIDNSINGEFAKKRWLQMRDRYRKELKMALRNMASPKWPYFQKLAWLDPYLKDTKNTSICSAALFNKVVNNSIGIKNMNVSCTNANGISENKKIVGKIEELRQTEIKYNSDESSELHKNRCLQVFTTTDTIFKDGQNLLSGSPDSATASTSSDCYYESITPSDEQGVINKAESVMPKQSLLNLELENDSESNFGGSSPSLELFESGKKLTSMRKHNISNGTMRMRHRNPPYLVRRGGSVRVRNSAFSLVQTPTTASPVQTLSDDASVIDNELLSKEAQNISMPPINIKEAAIFQGMEGVRNWNDAFTSSSSLLALLALNGQKTLPNCINWMSQLQKFTIAASTMHNNSSTINNDETAINLSLNNNSIKNNNGNHKEINNYNNKIDNSFDFASTSHNSNAANVTHKKQDFCSIKCEPFEKENKGVETISYDINENWSDDEDILFAKLIVVRLKKLNESDRRLLRARIYTWIDRGEEEIESRNIATDKRTSLQQNFLT